MAKVKLGLSNLSANALVGLATTIKTAMTGNANFTTPNPSLATIGTAITDATTKIAAYDSALAAADAALAARDASLTSLRNLLTQEAAYVENASGGDAAKIESAGMDVRDDRARVGLPAQVLNLVVTAGDNEGTLDASWDPVRGANSYIIQTSVDPVSPTSWAYKASSSKSRSKVNSFTSGARIWVRVRALGAAGEGPWSDPAVKTVP